jgi:hypothetical protein
MLRLHYKPRFLPGVLLALVMLAAQSLVLAHDLDHDPANAKNQVCTTCVAASQLGSAAVDHQADFEVAKSAEFFEPFSSAGVASAHATIVRQRGPPARF